MKLLSWNVKGKKQSFVRIATPHCVSSGGIELVVVGGAFIICEWRLLTLLGCLPSIDSESSSHITFLSAKSAKSAKSLFCFHWSWKCYCFTEPVSAQNMLFLRSIIVLQLEIEIEVSAKWIMLHSQWSHERVQNLGPVHSMCTRSCSRIHLFRFIQIEFISIAINFTYTAIHFRIFFYILV